MIPTSAPVASLGELLCLEELSDGRFRGRNGVAHGVGSSLYGGQVAAQALRAASLTVAPGRLPHSLHCYFLRPGSPDQPVHLEVQRERDGRSSSARFVRAVQGDEVILSMLTSFKVPEDGAAFDGAPCRAAPPPDRCPTIGWDDLIDVRMVSGRLVRPGVHLSDVAWMRARDALPDDPVLHCCALVYLTDAGSGFAVLGHDGLPAGGASIDHAVWFHQPIRADDWVLLDMEPIRASDARGTYAATARAADGRLGATVAQELVLRVRSR